MRSAVRWVCAPTGSPWAASCRRRCRAQRLPLQSPGGSRSADGAGANRRRTGYRLDMTAIDEDLLDAAATARDRAYVPYSGFAMGAAVRCTDGTVVPGTLIENVSLGLAMCAERVALFSAVAQG